MDNVLTTGAGGLPPDTALNLGGARALMLNAELSNGQLTETFPAAHLEHNAVQAPDVSRSCSVGQENLELNVHRLLPVLVEIGGIELLRVVGHREPGLAVPKLGLVALVLRARPPRRRSPPSSSSAPSLAGGLSRGAGRSLV
jgi:hypothetical protein